MTLPTQFQTVFSMFYAHTIEGKDPSHWETLDQHLLEVAELAKTFASKFSSGDWGWNAGILHDLGKATTEFQAYLKRENNLYLEDHEYDLGKINHSSAGAAFAEVVHGFLGRPLSAIVAGHHAGLPDYDGGNASLGDLVSRLVEGKSHLNQLSDKLEVMKLVLALQQSLPDFVKNNVKSYHLWVRMVFSCLVDSDYLNTERFMNAEIGKTRGATLSTESLKLKLDSFFVEMDSQSANTEVNQIRREIREACCKAALLKPGLFTLTVPTGGGKTLSSTAFALDHALKFGKERIIYVIPYTSIIEQNAAVLKHVFGEDEVIEHHSNIDPDRETQKMRLASENWDARIVVTTNVQFFESLYAAKPSRCRKLHNLVNSVVILDEAQMVPAEKLIPCVHVLNELTQNYGVTIVLSTATQPALPELTNCREIIPQELRLFERLKRTEYVFPKEINLKTDWDSLSDELKQLDQVLCIVNTRRDCFELYKLMPEGTIHLSALMCGAHRSQVIGLIKDKLKRGEPTRVISTQLVEAGVDLDFPVVYRAMAGLDSIAQAAGRCNREGKMESLGRVHVFIPPKPAPLGLLKKGEQTTRMMLHDPTLVADAPETFTRYFELFYGSLNNRGEEILKKLYQNVHPTRGFQPLDVPFRTVGEEFKLIDEDDTVSVFVKFGEGKTLLDRMKAEGPHRMLMRKLQRYSVGIDRRLANQLLIDGFIEEIQPGMLAQSIASAYEKEIGLNIFNPSLTAEDYYC